MFTRFYRKRVYYQTDSKQEFTCGYCGNINCILPAYVPEAEPYEKQQVPLQYCIHCGSSIWEWNFQVPLFEAFIPDPMDNSECPTVIHRAFSYYDQETGTLRACHHPRGRPMYEVHATFNHRPSVSTLLSSLNHILPANVVVAEINDDLEQ